MTTAAMHAIATTEANRSESTRRWKTRGETRRAAAALQKWRRVRSPSAPKASSALGIESPTTIRYEVATPKHCEWRA